MNERLLDFIQGNRIDSFQKISILLFLYQHAVDGKMSLHFARHLNFSVDPVLDEAVNDLVNVGLLEKRQEQVRLPNRSDVHHSLDTLARVYEDPIQRQHLLGLLYRRRPLQQ